MIKFINLDNGYTYLGEQPYIHWFPGEQSTNIIYTMPLCFICECPDVYAYIEPEVFYLLNIQQDKPQENIKLNDVSYADLNSLIFHPTEELPSMKLQGTPYNVNGKTYYIYLLYVMAQSDSGYECISDLQIIENYDTPIHHIYKIGADFYEENENLNVLLSNFGINIPTSVQKCFLESNTHEEKPDNILINRKFKELLSNYWDIIANKGSYKSLVNSLKWFEWGDNLKIYDIWSKSDFDKIRYEEKPLIEFLTDKYKSTINGFAKSTFISLSYALRKISPNKYENYNPVLEDVVSKWSKQDLMLKLSLLHRFYETYFLPIHEQIFHATVDDLIFTDVINIVNGSSNHKDVFIHDVKDFDIIINNNNPVQVSNVSVGVDKDTLFCNPYIGETDYDYTYGEYDEESMYYKPVIPKHTIVGVKPIEEIGEVNDKDFYLQNYSGLGSVIPISCELDLGTSWDMVHSEAISINLGPNTVSYGHDAPEYDWDEETILVHDNKIFKPIYIDDKNDKRYGHYIVNIDFNILCKTHSLVWVTCQLMFKTIGGQTFVKTSEFMVDSDSNVNLHLYRVNHVDDINSLYQNENVPKIPNNYLLKNVKNNDIKDMLSSPNGKITDSLYKMYLPSRNIGEVKFINEAEPFIKAFGYNNDGGEEIQTDQFNFTYDKNSYTIIDKRYESISDNIDYSYAVKLFIPLNSKEFIKNTEYKINYSINGTNIPASVDVECYICDIYDFNVYSDKKSLGYISDTPMGIVSENLMVNKEVDKDIYLCLKLGSFSSWKKIEINNFNISCPSMAGVAFNNLLIINNEELTEDIFNELNENYIITKKTATSDNGNNIEPQILSQSPEVDTYIDRNNIYFENSKLNPAEVHVKYGPLGPCEAISMRLVGSDFNVDDVLVINYIIHYSDGTYYKDQWIQKDPNNITKYIKQNSPNGINISYVEFIVEENNWQYFGIENVDFDIQTVAPSNIIRRKINNPNFSLKVLDSEGVYTQQIQDGNNVLAEGQVLYANLSDPFSLEVAEGSMDSTTIDLILNNIFPSDTQEISFYVNIENVGENDSYHILVNNEEYESYTPNELHAKPSVKINLKNFSFKGEDYKISIKIVPNNQDNFKYISIDNISYTLNKTYSVCVSKEFWYNPAEQQWFKKLPEAAVYRNDLVFFPEHHKLVPFGKNKIVNENDEEVWVRSEYEEDYILRNNDVLAVIPKISCNGKPVDFNWNNQLDKENTTWEFENLVTGKVYKYNYIQQPYVLGNDGELEPGYYNITFNYKLTDIEKSRQVKTGSVFIKK